MSRRFMAAASQYHKRVNHSSSNHQLLGDQDSEALLDGPSPTSSPGGAASALPRFQKRSATTSATTAATAVNQDPNVSAMAIHSPYEHQQQPQSHPSQPQSFVSPSMEPPQSEMAPEEGALQFLPAYQQVVTPSPHHSKSLPPGSSWDEDDELLHTSTSSSVHLEEKKEGDHAAVVSSTKSVVSASAMSTSSMAIRARQYKQQRKQRGAASAVNAGTGRHSMVATALLANALRSKSPAANRPKSPSSSGRRSPFAASFPKSPTRPKSPLAASPTRNNGSNPEFFAALPNDEEPEDEEIQERPKPVRRNSAGRVSRLASMFGGASPPAQRPVSPVSPYQRLRSAPQSVPVSPGLNRADHSPTLQPESTASPGGTSRRRNSQFSRPVSPGLMRNQQPPHRPVSPALSQQQEQPQVQPPQPQARHTHRPISPAASPVPSSSGSSSYVGWPGTQDRRGKTVFLQSSNEETSSAGAGGGSTFSWTASESWKQRNLPSQQQQQLQQPSYSQSAVGTGTGISSLMRRHQLQRPTPTTLDRLATRQTLHQRHEEPHSPPREDESDYITEALDASKAALSPPRAGGPLGAVPRRPTRLTNTATTNLRAAPMASKSMMLGGNHNNGTNATKQQHWSHHRNSADDPPSSPSTAFSKTSSAYFNERDVNPLAYPDFANSSGSNSFNPYAGRGMTAAAAASVLRSQGVHSQNGGGGLSEEALAANDHLTPPHRTFSSGAVGYRGLLNKTEDVHCLMDDTLNDSDNSSRATSSVASRASKVESDIFDGIAAAEQEVQQQQALAAPHKFVRSNSRVKKATYPESIAEEDDFQAGGASPVRQDRNYPKKKEEEPYKLVLLGGGLTAIQSSVDNYATRQTLDDFDETLSTSEVESNGFTRTPSLAEMMNAGKNLNDSSVLSTSLQQSPGYNHNVNRLPPNISPASSKGEDSSSLFSDPYNGSVIHQPNNVDLAHYYIEPAVMKKLLRVYRQISDHVSRRDLTLRQFENLEDEKKAFALFEMRSRIMEKDMERGLERRGGTFAVDDIVLTPYYRTSHRIRDAVIVAKAWRDGASPKDVTNTAILTQRAERTYFIRRPIPQQHMASSSGSVMSGGYSISSQRYYWEAVKWIDDTDFMLYHCPSLGPRNLRGFEMFTIGDCQSILLKLTNERCVELRQELNIATKEQLVAEEIMKEEGEDDGFGMMTESEMNYLAAMEKVKIVSKQLVVAEQSFTLVRDRIEKLIAKYEALLVRIDNEGSVAGASSVVTYEESAYSDDDLDSEAWQEREALIWARRAKRAELKAEVAAREALMARQEADYIRQESQYELERVQQQLAELQSEASTAISQREHKAVLHKFRSPAVQQHEQAPPASASAVEAIDKGKINSVKQRFRDRMAAKKKGDDYDSSFQQHHQSVPSHHVPPSRPMGNARHQSRPLTPSQMRQHQRQYQSRNSEKAAMNEMFRAAGEEMFSHLDFYERSLKSVQTGH